ncbi:DNA-binding transcriptional regulator, LysR family [Caloramator quimbayensis]|uniref:DNA-binding transcriptional regulator, LysR family n=1 Tax=Caloramator quimbayensis TaxID=1147123 RepID=A0A1T4Y5A0_9CLOT|nr:selenium metabolism-associated LysR family transcriptional regulator [Caloramator quimbayensis]SKA97004.1 DNA-binding transcriptional regulator, LysR family [Caloramator quimbayensis]
MDFKQIEAFVNVAKYKSFSKAAEAIFLSQPTVSAHIASLETELGVVLFDRSSKEIRLTQAGAVFLDYAINLTNVRNIAIARLSELGTKITGNLTIASSTTPCRFLLPQLLKTFYDKYPNVNYDIKEESTKEVVDMILLGNADVGIVGEIVKDAKLTYSKVYEDKLVIISSNMSLPDVIPIDLLLSQRFILRERGSATRSVFENSLSQLGIELDKIKIFAEVSSLEAVLQFVKAGAGVSVVSQIACKDYIQTGLLSEHSIKDLNITRGIYVVTHNKRPLSPVAKEFLKHIETFSEK